MSAIGGEQKLEIVAFSCFLNDLFSLHLRLFEPKCSVSRLAIPFIFAGIELAVFLSATLFDHIAFDPNKRFVEGQRDHAKINIMWKLLFTRLG